ncbi:hypothetical protein CSC64_02010 [Pseudoxanthomonas koreensis]|nr:hypothetical protein CSC64_02010 [Pseudoxanthomonas koreensis]
MRLILLALVAGAPVAPVSAQVADVPAAGADAAADVAPAVVPELLGGLLAESRGLYPLRVGGWKAMGEHRYEEQRLGVSVRYLDRSKQRWIDLYFYAGGLQDARTLALVAASERDAIAGAAQQAGRAVELGELQPLELTRGDGTPMPAWRLGLSYPQERRASAMLLFAQDLYLVKARASAEAPASVEVLQRALQAFMEQVAAQLRIVNTGACWLPDRITIVAMPPPADDESVLASFREPGQEQVAAAVVGDRVLVAQSHAARATELATGIAQVLYPGCVAPEEIEPEVPPVLREIRIEYRRPAREAQDGHAPPVGRPRPPTRATG